MSLRKFIELYSGNRNRNLYPITSDFTVPFAASTQNITPEEAKDAIVDGAIYYTFTLAPNIIPDYTGTTQAGSSTTSIYLDPGQAPKYSLQDGFYIGFTISIPSISETRIIRSYTASTGRITFDKPFSSMPASSSYEMYAGFPNENSIFIPSIDDNGNTILNYELAYNGYYVIFETPNPLYSNANNSNIFYRQISYYDYITHIAYFDKPLPFDYSTINTPQTFTLRKTLPSERWELDNATYLKSTPTTDPVNGPLAGCYVITLPNGAPSQNNFYKGKYVYYTTNTPQFYSPPLPNPATQQKPIPYVFYPIYGTYYIKAYNGTTRELSVVPDCIVPHQYPSYKNLGYDSSSFVAMDGIASITNVGGTEYQAVFTNPPLSSGSYYYGYIRLDPSLYQIGINYEFMWSIKKSANIDFAWFSVPGDVFYDSPCLMNNYKTYNFRITPKEQPLVITFYAGFDPLTPGDKYIQWELFTMQQSDIINICTFNRDNYSPLDYSGTMVSLNQATCYELNLVSLSLPNLPLLTGSKVAFYPYIYVEFDNVSSPTAHGTNVFYSNHPESSRAMFTATVYPASNPDQQTFMGISGSMSQTVKFKPNDALHLRIYLPNGELFQTILQDLLTPYEPWTRMQVQAVFSVSRLPHETK